MRESIHAAGRAAGERPGQETLLSGRDDRQAPAEAEVRRCWGLSIGTWGSQGGRHTFLEKAGT